MTQNQIAYWQLQETKRSNVARETEDHRHNVQDENIRYQANANTLYLGEMNLAETRRHNITTEIETERSNKAREAENYRSNVARELENLRHNQATEYATIRQQDLNYDIGLRNVELGYSNLAESHRHNVAGEMLGRAQYTTNAIYTRLGYEETVRSNKARETENTRTNMAKEAETNRSNTARETETHRANIAAESLRSEELKQMKPLRTSQTIQNYANSLHSVIDTATNIMDYDDNKRWKESQIRQNNASAFRNVADGLDLLGDK